MKKCLIVDPFTTWYAILNWGVKELKGRKMKDVL
jgi:hypothetical protein